MARTISQQTKIKAFLCILILTLLWVCFAGLSIINFHEYTSNLPVSTRIVHIKNQDIQTSEKDQVNTGEQSEPGVMDIRKEVKDKVDTSEPSEPGIMDIRKEVKDKVDTGDPSEPGIMDIRMEEKDKVDIRRVEPKTVTTKTSKESTYVKRNNVGIKEFSENEIVDVRNEEIENLDTIKSSENNDKDIKSSEIEVDVAKEETSKMHAKEILEKSLDKNNSNAQNDTTTTSKKDNNDTTRSSNNQHNDAIRTSKKENNNNIGTSNTDINDTIRTSKEDINDTTRSSNNQNNNAIRTSKKENNNNIRTSNANNNATIRTSSKENNDTIKTSNKQNSNTIRISEKENNDAIRTSNKEHNDIRTSSKENTDAIRTNKKENNDMIRTSSKGTNDTITTMNKQDHTKIRTPNINNNSTFRISSKENSNNTLDSGLKQKDSGSKGTERNDLLAVNKNNKVSRSNSTKLQLTTWRRLANIQDIPNVFIKYANCSALFHNSRKEQDKMSKWNTSLEHKKPISSLEKLWKGNIISSSKHQGASSPNATNLLTKPLDCETFKKYRKYIMYPTSKEEAEYPLAFSIMMYRNPQMVERLLRAIYRPQNVYCIHVDLKSNQDTSDLMTSLVDCFPNVVTAEKLNVTWGTMSVVCILT